MKYQKYLLILIMFVFTSCNRNEIEIITHDVIDKKDLKIKLKTLVDDKSFEEVVVFEKNNYYKIPNGYGENDWTIYYNDNLIFSFRHFKTNRSNSHNYTFEFDKIKDSIICNIFIEGIDDLSINNTENGSHGIHQLIY